MTQILRSERKHLGLVKLLFLGLPADLVSGIIEALKVWTIDSFIVKLATKFFIFATPAQAPNEPPRLEVFRSIVGILRHL